MPENVKPSKPISLFIPSGGSEQGHIPLLVCAVPGHAVLNESHSLVALHQAVVCHRRLCASVYAREQGTTGLGRNDLVTSRRGSSLVRA